MPGFLDFLNNDEALLGLGLLAAAGPSATPQSTGQRLFGGLMAFQQQKQSQEDRAARRGLLDAQLDETRAQAAQRRAVAAREEATMKRSASIADQLRALEAPSGSDYGMTLPKQSAAAAPRADEFGASELAGVPMFSQMGGVAPAGQPASASGAPMIGRLPAAGNAPAAAPPMIGRMPSPAGAAQGATAGQGLPDLLIRQAQVFARNGEIDSANKLFERAAQFMPAVHSIEVAMHNGQPVNVVNFKDGRQQVSPFAPAPKAHYLDNGSTIQAVDERTQQPLGAAVQKTMTPGENASNAVARGNLAVAQGNLGVSRQRLSWEMNDPRGQYDSERGVVVNPRTNVAMPVMMGGVPLTPKDKGLTEDQGKATGWLVQAENSWRNMQSAMGGRQKDGSFANLSPSRPGVNDVLAKIPGAGGTANWMRGDNRQRFIQASESLSESLLRAATGAGVNRDEAEQKVREITPQIGDGDDVVKQKLDAIPLYIESLKVRAGPGAVKAGAIGGASPSTDAPGLLPELPKANASNRGKLVRDHQTGKTLRSDGFQWKEVN